MRNRTVDIILGLAIAATGVFLMVFGAIEFSHIADMEAAGQVQGLTPKVKLVYTLLGKWGVLGVLGLCGVAVLASGVDRLWRSINNVPKSGPAV